MNSPQKHERKCCYMTNPLYNEKNIIGRLYRYFYIYFKAFSAPTIDTLFMLVLSILAMESATSIRNLYRHFLSGITEKSLNAFYYAYSYAKVDYSGFINVTSDMVFRLPSDQSYLMERMSFIFLAIDTASPARSSSCSRCFLAVCLSFPSRCGVFHCPIQGC